MPVKYATFPRTTPPPAFTDRIVDVFRVHHEAISTGSLDKGLTSDGVLSVLRQDLIGLGFDVEQGKHQGQKILRPVFFGDDGHPTLQYQVDAYHPGWQCGLEIEAGRAWMGNAIYRDLLQACVMVQVEVLALAVPNGYKYTSSGKAVVSEDFQKTKEVAEALYAHTRVRLPYSLILIGY